jgi:hypothetical protein
VAHGRRFAADLDLEKLLDLVNHDGFLLPDFGHCATGPFWSCESHP